MENGTKEKEELGAAYLQENFDVGGTADEVQYTFFFTYFFVFFCPIFPDQQMSGMFNKLNGPILSSWQYAPGLNLFSSQLQSSCLIKLYFEQISVTSHLNYQTEQTKLTF